MRNRVDRDFQAAFLREPFFEPGGESINLAQGDLAGGFKDCEGRILVVRSVKAARAGVEELMVVKGRKYRVEGKLTEVTFWINEWNIVMRRSEVKEWWPVILMRVRWGGKTGYKNMYKGP